MKRLTIVLFALLISTFSLLNAQVYSNEKLVTKRPISVFGQELETNMRMAFDDEGALEDVYSYTVSMYKKNVFFHCTNCMELEGHDMSFTLVIDKYKGTFVDPEDKNIRVDIYELTDGDLIMFIFEYGTWSAVGCTQAHGVTLLYLYDAKLRLRRA
jgi:hypothetical protein